MNVIQHHDHIHKAQDIRDEIDIDEREEDRFARLEEDDFEESFKQAVEDTEEQFSMSDFEQIAGLTSIAFALRELDLSPMRNELGNLENNINSIHRRGMDIQSGRISDRGIEGVITTPTSTRAQNWVRQQGAELVQNVTTETRNAIRQAVSRGIRQNLPTPQTAVQIRDSIGLTTRQEASVFRFRRLLQEGDTNALGRTLNASEQQMARRIISQGGTADEINELTRKYRSHKLTERAQKIARTETKRAIERGKLNQVRDLRDRGVISTARKVWRATIDRATCPFCISLNGTTLSLERTFNAEVENKTNSGVRVVNPEVPPAHPLCRCRIEYEVE